MAKTTVGVLLGGRSAEHEVSLQSGKNIIEAIDKDKYNVFPIGMNKQGELYLYESYDFLKHPDNPEKVSLKNSDNKLAVLTGETKGQFLNLAKQEVISKIDVIFPVLHGPYGEDGSIQGLLKLINLPFVGAKILGSAVGMDKDVMKRLLRDAKINIADFEVCVSADEANFKRAKEKFGVPFFVKPANLGSSVGVSKVKTEKDFATAIKEAFKFDNKVIVEEAIVGREIECSVLGNKELKASIPGEILPVKDFYSYEAKYIDSEGARLDIPADLSDAEIEAVQEIAVKTYKALCCQGLARVDVFLQEDGQIIVNEINTLPGFTRISMYPKLWEISGIAYSDLIDRLIQLALEDYQAEQKLQTSI